MKNRIGIVTVLYNSGKVLEEFFTSLDKQTNKEFILIIVDNKSTDNSLEIAYRFAKIVSFECIIIEENENGGIARGNNIGIKRALKEGCNYIILSNNDIVIPDSDTINTMLGLMLKGNIDILCPKIYYYRYPNKIWAAGGDFIRLDTATIHYGAGQVDAGQFEEEKIIRYTPTCFVIIKAEVFNIIGYMDEKYFVYYDDTDFMYRAWKSGLKIVYSPKANILHNESSITGVNSPFKIYQLQKNQLYFVKKNRPSYLLCGLIIFKSLLIIKHFFQLSRPLLKAEISGFIQGLKTIR